MQPEPGPNASALRREALAERVALFGVSLPALLLVTVTMIIPVVWLFWLSFLADDGSFSLEHYRRLIEQASYGRIFRATFEISAIANFIFILLGHPLAY